MFDDVIERDRAEMICEIANRRPLEEMVARATTSGQRRTKAEMTAFLAAVASIAYDSRPLTVRGLFYRCVATGLIPKDERAYTKVQRAARSLRISGVIAFADLRDGSRSVYDVDAFEDLDSWAQQVHHSYRRDVWANQPVRVECWCEKDAMAGVIADVTQRLGVDLFITRGFPSLSYTHAAAMRRGSRPPSAPARSANDDRADWRAAWALFPGDVAYVWHAGVHAATVAESLVACGFGIRAQIIWTKPRLVLSRGHYHWRHEPCWYSVRDGATGHWQGARDQTTVWAIAAGGGDGEDDATTHGTQKPVEAMRRPMINNSAAGDAVYEPFSGSGTTIIAAETTRRTCRAMELDPRYCDVAIERWQRFTGREAVLDGCGRTFEKLRGERASP